MREAEEAARGLRALGSACMQHRRRGKRGRACTKLGSILMHVISLEMFIYLYLSVSSVLMKFVWNPGGEERLV